MSDDKTPIKYVIIGDSGTAKIIAEFSSGNVESNINKERDKSYI